MKGFNLGLALLIAVGPFSFVFAMTDTIDCNWKDYSGEYLVYNGSSDTDNKTIHRYNHYASGQLAVEISCLENRKVSVKFVTKTDVFKEFYQYIWLDSGNFKRLEYWTHSEYMYVQKISEFSNQIDLDNKYYRFKSTHFNKERKTHEIYYLFALDLPGSRIEYNKKGNKKLQYQFIYDQNSTNAIGFKKWNGEAEFIGSYDEGQKLSKKTFNKVYAADSKEERERKWKHLTNPDRVRVLVFDTGFDFLHEKLAYKWISNESIGYNNDVAGAWPYENVDETSVEGPFSHGTMTSSLVAAGVEGIALLGISGFPMVYDFEKMEKYIKDNNVSFVNMSFSFSKPSYHAGFKGSAERSVPVHPKAMEFREVVAATPGTVYFSSAGNGDMNLGLPENINPKEDPVYPSSFPDPNIFVVGALEAADFKEEELPNYKVAGFSNYGDEAVDVFAPGVDNLVAEIGGGMGKSSGTSFSTPWVVNVATKMKLANRALSNLEIAEIILKTVYIPSLSEPLPCRSGGIVHPDRAIAVAKYMGDKGEHKINDAVLKVRSSWAKIPGEGNDKSYLKSLSKFWKDRNLAL